MSAISLITTLSNRLSYYEEQKVLENNEKLLLQVRAIKTLYDKIKMLMNKIPTTKRKEFTPLNSEKRDYLKEIDNYHSSFHRILVFTKLYLNNGTNLSQIEDASNHEIETTLGKITHDLAKICIALYRPFIGGSMLDIPIGQQPLFHVIEKKAPELLSILKLKPSIDNPDLNFLALQKFKSSIKKQHFPMVGKQITSVNQLRSIQNGISDVLNNSIKQLTTIFFRAQAIKGIVGKIKDECTEESIYSQIREKYFAKIISDSMIEQTLHDFSYLKASKQIKYTFDKYMTQIQRLFAIGAQNHGYIIGGPK